jgi:hypothetical protein
VDYRCNFVVIVLVLVVFRILFKMYLFEKYFLQNANQCLGLFFFYNQQLTSFNYSKEE